MKKIEQIKKNLLEKEKEVADLKRELYEEENKSEWIKVPETEFEVEKNVHHKGKSYDELKKEFGEEYLKENLIDLELLGRICKNPELMKELKMDGSSTKDDFFFRQPFPQNEANGYVARFNVYSGYAGLDCWIDSVYSSSALGVRFARKISKTSKK